VGGQIHWGRISQGGKKGGGTGRTKKKKKLMIKNVELQIFKAAARERRNRDEMARKLRREKSDRKNEQAPPTGKGPPRGISNKNNKMGGGIRYIERR